jgi:hypothetical protein
LSEPYELTGNCDEMYRCASSPVLQAPIFSTINSASLLLVASS